MKVLKLTTLENNTIYLASDVIRWFDHWPETSKRLVAYTCLILGPDQYFNVKETPETIIAIIEGTPKHKKIIPTMRESIQAQRDDMDSRAHSWILSGFSDEALKKVDEFLESLTIRNNTDKRQN